MKKIIAVLVAVCLLLVQAQPVAAQRRQLAKGIANLKLGAKRNPAAGKTFTNPRLLRLDTDLFKQMRLPLTQNYAALLGNTDTFLSPAAQILAHQDVTQRALLLRSDFVALALNNRAAAEDIAQATDFYRENLRQFKLGMREQTVQTAADIAALGILGTPADADLILKTAQKAVGTVEQAALTAAAARALLRLEAYPQLEKLSDIFDVQPELWDGLAAYAADYKLPVKFFTNGDAKNIDISALQEELLSLGPLNAVAIDPSLQSTYLYMNAGKEPAVNPANALPAMAAQGPVLHLNQAAVPLQLGTSTTLNVPERLVAAPTQTAALAMADQADRELAALVAQYKPAKFSEKTTQFIAQTKQWINRLKPTSADDTAFSQRAALYLTAFSIGLEIGTPIMASIKSALNLPLSFAILVTAATYSPYLFGSFIANWLKTKVGRKGTINTGLALAGGSFTLGALGLGFDGSFTAWDNPIAQYVSLLGVLTAASTGCVFIHTAVGPIMTEISHKASELVRQKRGTYVEFSRSIGMMASFAFPFIATSLLGLDWSAPFLMALPVIGGSALALNLANLPNTKPAVLSAPKLAQSPVMDGVRKARKAMKWKDSILNNGYVRMLREEPGTGSFISALFIMNTMEVAFQSGFLFMIPQLTTSESSQYLLGMAQYAVAFLMGRALASSFLRWFPKRNISAATLLAAAGGAGSLAFTNSAAGLTASLFTAELGISTAFTLAFASTAKQHATQDRLTSLIMASAIGCAVGPFLLTQMAKGAMNAGMMGETGATIATLIAIPTALALFSAKLFRRMENKTVEGLQQGSTSWTTGLQNLWQRIKQLLNRN